MTCIKSTREENERGEESGGETASQKYLNTTGWLIPAVCDVIRLGVRAEGGARERKSRNRGEKTEQLNRGRGERPVRVLEELRGREQEDTLERGRGEGPV